VTNRPQRPTQPPSLTSSPAPSPGLQSSIHFFSRYTFACELDAEIRGLNPLLEASLRGHLRIYPEGSCSAGGPIGLSSLPATDLMNV
jgi:hypothetical protein